MIIIICIQNLHNLSLYKSTVPSVGLAECVTMGTFKGGGTGVLEGKSLSLMTTGSDLFADTTPLFCCVAVLTPLELFSSDGGGTSFTSVVALESDLLASLSSEDKPFALSCSSLYIMITSIKLMIRLDSNQTPSMKIRVWFNTR